MTQAQEKPNKGTSTSGASDEEPNYMKESIDFEDSDPNLEDATSKAGVEKPNKR